VPPRQVELRLTDLGLGDTPITASVWHANLGDSLLEGGRLLEVAAGEVTVDLSSPAPGTLVAKLVEVDDELAVGQVLGIVAAS
jgi:pyruvate/2-oxoglutarate dehydrogenase complex dihydrolipoamide acyltransferase (E2) component